MLRGIVGGILGGLTGAAAWTIATALSGTQLGLGLWLVGLMAGVGVAVGNGRRGSAPAGFAAVAIALGAVVAGKAAGSPWTGEQPAFATSDGMLDETGAVMHLERQVQRDWAERGSTSAIAENGVIPPEVRTEAARLWRQMSERERTQYMASAGESARAATGFKAPTPAMGGLQLIDVLWFVLALATAYKVAAYPPASAKKAGRVEKPAMTAPRTDDLSSASWGRRIVPERADLEPAARRSKHAA